MKTLQRIAEIENLSATEIAGLRRVQWEGVQDEFEKYMNSHYDDTRFLCHTYVTGSMLRKLNPAQFAEMCNDWSNRYNQWCEDRPPGKSPLYVHMPDIEAVIKQRNTEKVYLVYVANWNDHTERLLFALKHKPSEDELLSIKQNARPAVNEAWCREIEVTK